MLRPISITDAADAFLTGFERRLLAEGCSASFISAVAQELFELVFDRIPKGNIRPIYHGVEDDLPGYSVYSFSEGRVHGKYASTPDHVILLKIDVYRPPIAQKSARTSAA